MPSRWTMIAAVRRRHPRVRLLAVIGALVVSAQPAGGHQRLRWGGDAEGGAPFIQADPGGRLQRRRADAGESKYLLPGLARCAVCNGTIHVRSLSHGRKRAHYYGCAAYHERGTKVCANGAVVAMDDRPATRRTGGVVPVGDANNLM